MSRKMGKIAIIALLTVMGLSGCVLQGRTSGNMGQNNLTPAQRSVLESTLIDEQRAAKGALSTLEKRLLEGAEAIYQELVNRYPNTDFTLKGMSTLAFNGKTWNMDGVWNNEKFVITGVSEKADFSDLAVTDSLFSLLKRQEMTQLLCQWLADAGAVNPMAYVSITGQYDERYDRSATIEALLGEGLEFSGSAQVFVSKDSNEELDADWLVKALRNKGVNLLVNFWVVPMMPEGEPTRNWTQEVRWQVGVTHYDVYVGGEQ